MTAPLSPNAPDPSANATPDSPSSTPAGTPAAPWTAGEHAPEWARGRTAEEILNLGDKMYGILQSFNQQNQIAPTPAAAPPSAPPAAPLAFSDDDYVQGRQVKEFVNHLASTQLGPELQRLQEATAQNTYVMAKDRHREVFAKYGPEVDLALAGVPKANWTLPLIDKVVKFVQSEHLDELVESKARERAQQLVGDMGSTGMRSSGAPGVGAVPQHNHAQHTLADPTINADWKARAADAGLTEAQIDGFCRATGDTREQFFARLASGSVKAVPRG